jgi:DNA segregation ATPase FtsK/SpoIIIE-like protein
LDTRIPVALINPADAQRHYLVIGGTGAGKSMFVRAFIARALRAGWFPGGVYIFDGKGGSDYIVFEGREGVHCVARHPDEWEANLAPVVAMMRQRYDADAEYERGNRPKPDLPRYLVIVEEVQEIRATLGKDVLDPFLQQISRQMRASNGRLMVVTQRPDVSDAMPGAVRDMLEDRIVLGFISQKGAQMAMDQDWRAVVDEYGTESVPGRGMARIGGKLIRIQGFYLPSPREHPEVEHLYPRKLDQAGQSSAAEPPLPHNVARWAPRPAAPPQAPDGPQQPPDGSQGSDQGRPADEVDSDAPTPPHGIPRIGLAVVEPDTAEAPGPASGTGPHDPPPGPPDGGRRRRRTV